MSDKVYVAGVGMGRFTKPSQQYPYEKMGGEAVAAAIEDAGLSPADIDGVMPNELAGTIAEDFIAGEIARGDTFRSRIAGRPAARVRARASGRSASSVTVSPYAP